MDQWGRIIQQRLHLHHPPLPPPHPQIEFYLAVQNPRPPHPPLPATPWLEEEGDDEDRNRMDTRSGLEWSREMMSLALKPSSRFLTAHLV